MALELHCSMWCVSMCGLLWEEGKCVSELVCVTDIHIDTHTHPRTHPYSSVSLMYVRVCGLLMVCFVCMEEIN